MAKYKTQDGGFFEIAEWDTDPYIDTIDGVQVEFSIPQGFETGSSIYESLLPETPRVTFTNGSYIELEYTDWDDYDFLTFGNDGTISNITPITFPIRHGDYYNIIASPTNFSALSSLVAARVGEFITPDGGYGIDIFDGGAIQESTKYPYYTFEMFFHGAELYEPNPPVDPDDPDEPDEPDVPDVPDIPVDPNAPDPIPWNGSTTFKLKDGRTFTFDVWDNDRPMASDNGYNYPLFMIDNVGSNVFEMALQGELRFTNDSYIRIEYANGKPSVFVLGTDNPYLNVTTLRMGITSNSKINRLILSPKDATTSTDIKSISIAEVTDVINVKFGYGCSIYFNGVLQFETVPPTFYFVDFLRGAEIATSPTPPPEPEPDEPFPVPENNKCILYQNMSESINIVKKLNAPREFNMAFRDSVSVTTPIIRLETTENLSVYNYAYLEVFNRRYFINRATLIKKNLWELELRVDVLSTFSRAILDTTALIDRWEGSTQALPDPTMSKGMRTIVSRIDFNTTTKFNDYTPISFGTKPIEMSYVLTTTAVGTDISGVQIKPPYSYVTTPDFMTSYAISGTSIGALYDIMWKNNDLINEVREMAQNPWSLIYNVSLFPINYNLFKRPVVNTTLTEDIPEEQIFIGRYGLPTDGPQWIRGKRIENGCINKFYVGSFSRFSFESFEDYPPYREGKVWAPFYGYIDIDISEWFTKMMLMFYTIDWATGDCIITLEYTDGTIIQAVNCKIGSTTIISSDDKTAGVLRSLSEGLIKTLTNALSSAAVSGSSGAATSLAKDVSTTINSVTSASMSPSYSQGGSIGGTISYSMPLKPYVMFKENRVISQREEGVAARNHIIGAPYNQVGKISEHSGFLTVGSCHISIPWAQDSEIAEIENLLRLGVVVP